MQRALSASQLPAPTVKTNPAANKASPSTVQPQKTLGQTENEKKELVKSGTKTAESPVVDLGIRKEDSTHGSPQKAKSKEMTQANKEIKKEENAAPGSQKPHAPTVRSEPKLTSKDQPKESDQLVGVSSPNTRTEPAKTTESVTGKMFGFGSSIFSSASTLISSAVQEDSRTTPPGSRKMSAPAQVSSKLSTVPQISPKTTPPVSPKMAPAKETQAQRQEQSKKQEEPQRIKQENNAQKPTGLEKRSSKAGENSCPLCKAKINIGSEDPPNHNTCTECKSTVCNQCGFTPMPMGEVSISLSLIMKLFGESISFHDFFLMKMKTTYLLHFR